MNKIMSFKKNLQKLKKKNFFENLNQKVIFGFWLYMMSDCIVFATMFSVYEVMYKNIANGPDGKTIFSLSVVFFETFFLLLSSWFISISLNYAKLKNKVYTLFYLFLTFLCGIFFIFLEIFEFFHFFSLSYLPEKSGFLSSFYGLLSLHGLHVFLGLLWIIILFFQILIFNFNKNINTQILCFSIFWHFLDIIWIFLFSFVYLIGKI